MFYVRATSTIGFTTADSEPVGSNLLQLSGRGRRSDAAAVREQPSKTSRIGAARRRLFYLARFA